MDDPTGVFHLQVLTDLTVFFPYRLLPPTAFFSSGQSHLALILGRSWQLDLQRRHCRGQDSSWSRSILFATTESPTIDLLRGDALVILLLWLLKPCARSQAQNDLPRGTGAFCAAVYRTGSLPPPSCGTGRKHIMLPEIMPSIWHTPGGVKKCSCWPHKQPCPFCIGHVGKITLMKRFAVGFSEPVSSGSRSHLQQKCLCK